MTSGQHLASDEPGKRLLALGNEAFARGAIEAGVQLDALPLSYEAMAKAIETTGKPAYLERNLRSLAKGTHQ